MVALSQHPTSFCNCFGSYAGSAFICAHW
uniref:Uncharacterized protein n=1 Tax=Anguilla anguilla TaxID=7936 RepID=A0A0E9VQY3_ANGAN